MKYHHITGLVEEDTISRQSSCPSPTMIGALHGRDVVLRSATVDVIIPHCHLHNVMAGTQHRRDVVLLFEELDQEPAGERWSS